MMTPLVAIAMTNVRNPENSQKWPLILPRKIPSKNMAPSPNNMAVSRTFARNRLNVSGSNNGSKMNSEISNGARPFTKATNHGPHRAARLGDDP